jgi:hypothetical protein
MIKRTWPVRDAGDAQSAKALFLHVGLADGTLMRSDVDGLSGALSDVRKRYLGTRSPTLLPAAASGAQALLALTSRPWLAHLWQARNCSDATLQRPLQPFRCSAMSTQHCWTADVAHF